MILSEYFTNQSIRRNTPSTIMPDGTCFYKTEMGNIPFKEFEEMYPLGIITKYTEKGDNSDRTKAWMQDKRSY